MSGSLTSYFHRFISFFRLSNDYDIHIKLFYLFFLLSVGLATVGLLLILTVLVFGIIHIKKARLLGKNS